VVYLARVDRDPPPIERNPATAADGQPLQLSSSGAGQLSSWALVSLTCGVLSLGLLCMAATLPPVSLGLGLVAIVAGWIGRRGVPHGDPRGVSLRLATAGLVSGVLGVGATLAVLLLVFVGPL
jgi:hypothetical protein